MAVEGGKDVEMVVGGRAKGVGTTVEWAGDGSRGQRGPRERRGRRPWAQGHIADREGRVGEEVEVVEALVGVDDKKGGVPETEPFVKARDAGQRVGARCGSIRVSLRTEKRGEREE